LFGDEPLMVLKMDSSTLKKSKQKCIAFREKGWKMPIFLQVLLSNANEQC
jgi:hypothetical protein